MELRVPAEMALVDDGAGPGPGAAARVPLRVEIGVDDDAFRHERRAVALVEGRVVTRFELIAEDRRVPRQIAEMPAGVRVEHQLVRVEAVPVLRLVGAIYPITIDRAGMHSRDVALPDLVGIFRQFDSRRLALPAVAA